uniref:lipocalin-1 n=1 Tax=Urocitellus parryii TaxID=9999 RepID=UPI000E55D7DB|nr:lipocalin-1 [Urocitellus parryii]
MQRLLLTLGLASVLHAMELLPAQPEELVGKWHILLWMGSPIIPGLMMTSPPPPQMTHSLPPFWMELSKEGLMIKVKLRQPSGHCEEMKTTLWKTDDPTKFMADRALPPEKQQAVHIWATRMKMYYIMHTQEKMKDKTMHMTMLIGPTMEKKPEAVKMFQEFVESEGMDKARVMAPSPTGNDRRLRLPYFQRGAAPPDPCMAHHR